MSNVIFFLQKEKNRADSDSKYSLILKEFGCSGHVIIGMSSDLSLLVENHLKLDSSYALKDSSDLRTTDKPIDRYDAFYERSLVDKEILDNYRVLYAKAQIASNQQI